MEILNEKKLDSGQTLRVLHWCSPEKAPGKYTDFILASVGTSEPHRYLYSNNGWRAYFSDAMNGDYYPEVVDHWFFAEVDGECAGRIWFGYSSASLRGNFGNVLTVPKYRGHGIMTELMKQCMAEIHRSPAEMLCCIAGQKITPVYLKYGFQLIHGGDSGPLCFSKKDTFLIEAERVFAGSSIKEVRPGGIGDQFDCDKFLVYAPELWKREHPVQTGPAAFVSDFRLALQESFAGNSVVYVALNERKVCCGYAFAVMLPSGMPVLDFVVHPAYLDDAAGLIRTTVSAFLEKFGASPFYYGLSADTGKIAAALGAGMVQIAEIPSGLYRREQSADMTVLMSKRLEKINNKTKLSKKEGKE